MASPDHRPVALITGSNRGTGLAIADELARRGYRIASLNRTLLGRADLGERVCDLADPAAVRRAADEVVATRGRLDVCVLNAVVRELAPIASISAESWNTSLAVNLTSVLTLIQATLPAIRASGGLYVLMGSHAGSRFFETGVAYSATKAALRAVLETLLLEERPHGVRAALLSPGAIANAAGDSSPVKMAATSVARCVGAIAQDFDPDLVVGELEIRPARLTPPLVQGLDRLQGV